MLYDLNISWSASQSPQELHRTIVFLSSLGYNVLALNHAIGGPVAAQISNPIPVSAPFALPSSTRLLRRCTVTMADPAQNHRLPALAAAYDILAVRPTTEKAFLAACTSLSELVIISLDLTQRFPFHFRPKPLMTAVNRGVRFEICYSQGTLGDSICKRNFITNVLGIIRATKGRGIVLSSGSSSPLGVRAPADVVNLMNVWGLGTERATDALGVTPRGIVVNEGLKRSSYKGVVDVIYAGEQKQPGGNKDDTKTGKGGKNGNEKKRDIDAAGGDSIPPISKRQALKLKRAALKSAENSSAENILEKKVLSFTDVTKPLVQDTVMNSNTEDG